LLAQAVIIWLQACGNVTKVAEIMRLDWQTVNKIVKAAVERGLLRRGDAVIEHAGIDEKSFRRGHVYASILNGLDNNRVWDLVEGRKTDNAMELLDTLTGEQRLGVKPEHRALMKEGDETLKNSKFDWLRNFPDLRCEPTFQSLYNANLETSKAWRLKESFSGFWDYIYEGSAVKFFKDWCKQVHGSNFEPVKKASKMLGNRL
jgi:transposase